MENTMIYVMKTQKVLKKQSNNYNRGLSINIF
jgi:hypothetical protein